MLTFSPLRNSLMPPFRGGEIFRDLQRMQQTLDQFLDEGWRTTPAEYPPINVWNNGDGALLTTEIPGVSADDLEISVVNNTLTLRGERAATEAKEGVNMHRQERWSGKFVRTMELAFAVDADQVDAEFHDGILTIKLPRAEVDKPKQIAVKTS